jgi:hypothetical protein
MNLCTECATASHQCVAHGELLNTLLICIMLYEMHYKQVETQLQALKEKNRAGIPYLFCRHGSPGYFVLLYLPAKVR